MKNIKEFIKQLKDNLKDILALGRYNAVCEKIDNRARNDLIDNHSPKVVSQERSSTSTMDPLPHESAEDKEPEDSNSTKNLKYSTSGSDYYDEDGLQHGSDDVCEKCGHRRACHSLDVGDANTNGLPEKKMPKHQ